MIRREPFIDPREEQMILAAPAHATSMTRIVLADPRRFFAAALGRLLSDDPGLLVAVETTDAPTTVRSVGMIRPEVVLISHGLVQEIPEILGQLQAVSPETAVIVHGIPHAGDLVHEALRAGVKGLIDQEADLDEVLAAVQGVAVGRIVISPHLAAQVGGAGRDAPNAWNVPVGEPPLSPREVEVLRLVAEGASNRQAAQTLGLSEHTVRAHLRAVMRKLKVQSRVHAVALAVQSGMLRSTDSRDGAI